GRDDRPRAAALAAGTRDGEETLLVPELAATVAGRAGGGAGPGSGAAALALLAALRPRELDRGLRAACRFLERDLEVVAEMGPLLRPGAPARSAAEELAEPEDVAEAREDVLEAGERARVEADAALSADAGM